MESRRETLNKRERDELKGYVAPATAVLRGLLYLVALVVVALVCRRLQRSLALPDWLWLLPTLGIGASLYVRSARWTGGSAFRRQVRLDLEANTALVHRVRLSDAILFEEQEDEGPIVFALTDTGEALVFCGQDLARDVSRGFPWREFDIRESPNSRMFFRLKRVADALPPSLVKPPLSREEYKRLGLASVRRWGRLDKTLNELRRLS